MILILTLTWPVVYVVSSGYYYIPLEADNSMEEEGSVKEEGTSTTETSVGVDSTADVDV